MDWIPLFAGGAVIYGATTFIAGRLLRRQAAEVEEDSPRRVRARVLAREAEAKPRFSAGLLNRAPLAKDEPKKKPAIKPPQPVPPEPFNGGQREALNRQVAAKIDQVASELKSVEPDTLALDQAVTQPLLKSELDAATREAQELVGKIQSLDFTLDEKDPMADTAIVDIVTLEVSPDEPEKAREVADVGATLLLDTEDLLKAIRGGAPSMLPVDPISIPTLEPAVPAPAGPPDWESALKSLRDSNAIADANGSFFDAPADSRDMGTTQLFRLDTPLTAMPDARAASPPGPSMSAVDAVADGDGGFVAPDFTLPEFATTAAKAALGPSTPKAGTDTARPRGRAAQVPGAPIRHPRFHRLAVAHDDIQAARIAFESLLDAGADAIDPAGRVMLFGALMAYGRPFQQNDDGPICMSFSSERFAGAHEELLAARAELLGAAQAGHDRVLRLQSNDDGASFAVQTELVNDARLPMYVALCNFLEAQLLELLHDVGEHALADA